MTEDEWLLLEAEADMLRERIAKGKEAMARIDATLDELFGF